MFLRRHMALVFGIVLSVTADSRANEAPSSFSHLGGNVGSSFVGGFLGNSSAGLTNRLMDAVTVEGLLGYRFEKLLLGVDFDYRWEGQLASLSAAGGTNLKGYGWILGLGANYAMAPEFSLQGSLGLTGVYELGRHTYASEDDRFTGALALRIKGQYFIWPSFPLSIDADFQYLNYRVLRISSTDYNQPSTSFLVGFGLTWHFGAVHGLEAGPVIEPPPAPAMIVEQPPLPPVQNQEEELAKVADVKRTDRGLMLLLKGDVSFASGSSKLSPKALSIVNSAAAILVRNPTQKIRVEGHTDSSGNKVKNQALSVARAESVKDVLVSQGLDPENVTAEGFGPDRPAASNESPEGRAVNRRVEIYIEDGQSLSHGIEGESK